MTSDYYTSLWDFKPGEFRALINTITPKSKPILEVLAGFRELPVLPRKFREMVVADVSANSELIQELLDTRKAMLPENGFKLGCKPKVREQQLIDSLAESYKIDKAKTKAKVVIDQYDNRPTQCYTYALEVVIAPRTDLRDYDAGKIEIIDCINNDASSDGNGAYFANGIYEWTEKKRGWFGTEYNKRRADSLRGLLYDCGFVMGTINPRRRKPCVLFINLRCRVIEWLGAKGKTQINTKPFAQNIAETVSALAYKMSTYHGEGYGRQYSSYDDEEDSRRGEYMEPYLKPFLIERRRAVEADPSLRVKDRLTQSGVWYRIRPRMLEDGFKPRNKSTDSRGRTIYEWGTTRKGLTGGIRKAIKELWPKEKHVTREYLGIVAKARAMMYFNGQVLPVSFDSKEELANAKTTDLVIVEKEGITDVLLGAARRYRIALVATGGELSDYAKDLARLADDAGLNVCVLTDYDIHGIDIWRHAGTDIAKIGIDRDIVTWLQENGYHNKDGNEITEEDVHEEYQPNLKLFQEDDDEYLQHHRIELDSIVEKAGANALFHYMIEKLEEVFPYARDYSEVIPEPEPQNYYTEEVNKFIEYIKNYTIGVYHDGWTEIKGDAEDVDGLTDVDLEEEANDIILKPIVHEDEGTKTISTKLKDLMESGALPKVKEIKEEDEEPKPKSKPKPKTEREKGSQPKLDNKSEEQIKDPFDNIFRDMGLKNPSKDPFDNIFEDMFMKNLPKEFRCVIREIFESDAEKHIESNKSINPFLNTLPKEERESNRKSMMNYLRGPPKDELTKCKHCNATVRLTGNVRIEVEPDPLPDGNYRCHDCQHLFKDIDPVGKYHVSPPHGVHSVEDCNDDCWIRRQNRHADSE